MKINSSWVEWARDKVALLKNGGYLIFPSDGAIFQVNHQKFTLELICCKPSWIKSHIEFVNKEVFSKIGYRYIRNSVPTSAETMISKIFTSYQFYASDIDTLIHGIEIIFKVDSNKIIQKIRKKTPINPVTIYTKKEDSYNLTASRLWIGSESIPDTSYKFDPSIRQSTPRWDKPVTIGFWKNENASYIIHAMVLDEEEFLEAVKKLPLLNGQSMKIFGVTKYKSQDKIQQEHMSLILTLKEDKLLGVLFSSSGDNLASTELSFSNFMQGLQHLFPNGEIDI